MPPRTKPRASIDKVVAYTRVSTSEQGESGAGLQAQRQAVEAECGRRGWTIIRWCEDIASGRSQDGRDGLEDALELVRDGSAGTLVVAKLDRLTRSLIDFASLLDEASSSRGWNLVAIDVGVDLSTPSGEFLATVMAGAARWERRIIGQRTKDALAVRRAAGVRLGRPPELGQATVDRILSERRAGRSLTEIARRLDSDRISTARGGLRWYPATVAAVLNSRHVALRARAT
jgi:DNA invertase Pin-like site-specific DNA recombinase